MKPMPILGPRIVTVSIVDNVHVNLRIDKKSISIIDKTIVLFYIVFSFQSQV